MVNNKIKLGLLLGLAAVFVIVTVFFTTRNGTKPYKATTAIDPDTGEILVTDTNQPEKVGNDAYITLQGSDKLYNVMTSQQFNLLRDLIGQYVRTSISGDIQVVKVLPNTVKLNDDETRGSFDMKIDKPAASLSATITIYRNDGIRLVVKNNAKPSDAEYDTGLIFVDQEVDGEYGGDGAPPEETGN